MFVSSLDAAHRHCRANCRLAPRVWDGKGPADEQRKTGADKPGEVLPKQGQRMRLAVCETLFSGAGLRFENQTGLTRQPFVERGKRLGVRPGVTGNRAVLAELKKSLTVPQDCDGASATIVAGAHELDGRPRSLLVSDLKGAPVIFAPDRVLWLRSDDLPVRGWWQLWRNETQTRQTGSARLSHRCLGCVARQAKRIAPSASRT